MNFTDDIDVVALEAVTVERIDKASKEQLVVAKQTLYNRWNVKLRAQAGNNTVSMDQRHFNLAYVRLLITLAAYGSSERLQSHPDLLLTAPRPQDVEGEGDITAMWPLVNLRECLVTSGISTIRRFARAEANTVYRYWTAHPPAERTAWHNSSGIAPEHFAIAFDFADYIDAELLSADQRQIVKNARKYTIRNQAALLNENESIAPSMQ